jgi:hypothetical protein
MVDVLLIPTVRRALTSVLATAALSAVYTAGCGGKGAEGQCPLIDACGGDATGSWQMLEAFCQYQPVRPAQPTDVNDFMMMPLAPTLAPPQPQPTEIVPTTSGDWCSALDFPPPPDGISNVSLWHDAPQLQPGSTVVFNSDTTYQAVYLFSTNYPGANNTTHFAPICLTANGGDPTCAELAAGLTKFYAAGNAVPAVGTNPAPPPPPATFGNIQCTTSAVDEGCDCTYVYQLQVVDQGNWSAADGTIFEESSNFAYNGVPSKLGSPAQTMQAAYCQQGTTLKLSGARGASLSDLLGLRTMVLQK